MFRLSVDIFLHNIMWNISIRVLLLFLPVLFASLTNDCKPRGHGKYAIHACQESSFSGTTVAMDASMLTGSFQLCECTLTTSSNAGSKNVTFVDVIYAYNTNRTTFSVYNKTYTDTSSNNKHNFDGDSIRVVVEKTYTGEMALRTGNPCIVFKSREKENTNLTLSCLNGTTVDPRTTVELITSNAHAATITAPSRGHSDIHDTSYITTSSTSKITESVEVTTSREIITTAKPSTSTTTGSVKVSTNELEQSSTMLNEMETMTSVTQDVTTGSNELQKNILTKSGGLGTVIIIVIVVVAVVCIAIIIVLITCYCRRRKRSPIKADENTIKPRKKDDYVVTENEMYVPIELLNEQNYTQDSTDHVYDQPDVDIVALRANGNETKPLLQERLKADDNTIKPSKKDDYEVTENAMYEPFELLNKQNNTQDSTDHVNDQPDVDIVALRANKNETKPL